jgi:hypothetical protein
MTKKNKKAAAKGKEPKVRKIGSIAYGFHEGGRSEYLAQYAFSAFGTSILVPRQEDSGVDLQCGLGERIGHRVLIRASYLVQVKSNRKDIEFEDADAVRWLLSQVVPLFVALVDKSTATIEVYQTLSAVMQSARSTPKTATLSFDADATKQFSIMEGDNLTIPLGSPILSFDAGDLSDDTVRRNLHEVLAFWIELVAENVQQAQYGLPMFQYPKNYVTNTVHKGPWGVTGNLASVSDEALTRLKNATFKTLATHLHLLAFKNERAKCIALRDGVGVALLDDERIADSWGSRALGVAYEGTSKAFKIPNPFVVTGGPPGAYDFSGLNVVPPKPRADGGSSRADDPSPGSASSRGSPS